MQTEVSIPGRFNGPPNSGNGGYSCGLLGALVDGPARVRLHVPPPLDTPMRLEHRGDGGVEMYDGDTLVGSAAPATLELEAPPAPSPGQAAAAARRFPCYHDHLFPTCFVCGPGRDAGDGLQLFTGPVDAGDVVACTWQPDPDLADGNGRLLTEVVWAALDCPGYFAAFGDELLPAVLGELVGRVDRPVPCNGVLVVYAWPLGQEGRKFYAGSAVANSEGEVLALAHSTWIQLKQ